MMLLRYFLVSYVSPLEPLTPSTFYHGATYHFPAFPATPLLTGAATGESTAISIEMNICGVAGVDRQQESSWEVVY